ncbi:hypothetical protein CCS79_01475 [Clostridium diolis]|uniref:hypothetical protein n=1 Tax=Clostridium diolis TaxID=223919 RepID=UPI000B403EDE|nr:hypothetical protein [Clostridium diolis]OVE70669.1 hypothetical protein CCS79_01475 [Clostridium diolis]
MKYKYEFSFIELANGSKDLIINLPKEIELVTSYLVQMCGNEDWYIKGIVDVLSGYEEYQERDGEFYGLEIRKDFIRVHDVFDMGTECTIETSELKELIEIWEEESKKYII